jgi:hypothetical protein
MTKKNTTTTNVYERVSKSELFAYMNSSLPSMPEKARLHQAFLRNVDLFKTIRHGKTIILGSDAAKKYIEEERKSNLFQFIVWALLFSVGAGLLMFIAHTIDKHPVLSFSDIMMLVVMLSAEVFIVSRLIQTFIDKRTLNTSEEHVDRGINPDYYEIDFEVGDKVSYNSFTDDDSIVIVRTQNT